MLVEKKKGKIKVLMICDHSLVLSGVALQSKYMIEGLLRTDRYQFLSFASAIRHDNYSPLRVQEYDGDWVLVPTDGYGNPQILREVLDVEKPDALLIFTDPRFFGWLFEMVDEVSDRGIPLLYNTIWDNLPTPTFNKFFYDSCDFLGCISKLTYGIMKDLGLEYKAEYIPHAVPTSLFHPMDEKLVQEEKIKLFGEAKKDSFIIFYCSRSARRKKTNDLVLAFKQFADQIGDKDGEKCFLVMNTDPNDPEGSDLLQVAQMLKLKPSQITFSKQRIEFDKLALLYNIADVTSCVSAEEGFGLCLDPASEIQLKDGKIKDLKEVEIGDEVLSMDGKYHNVLAKKSRIAETLKISTVGNPDIICSFEHPFYVMNKRGDVSWKRADQISVKDKVAVIKPDWNDENLQVVDLLDWFKDRENISFDDEYIWTNYGYSPYKNGMSLSDIKQKYSVSKATAENVRRDIFGLSFFHVGEKRKEKTREISKDIVDTGLSLNNNVVKIKRKIKIDDDFLSFVGWYLAEGSNSGGAVIEIDLHKREKNIAEYYNSYFNKIWGISGRVECKDNKSRLVIPSCILAEFFSKICGNHAHHKSLHPMFLKNAKMLAPVMKGLFSGDGHGTIGSWKLSTVSKCLAWEVRNILSVNNIYCSVKKRIRKTVFSVGRIYYDVGVFGDNHERFCKWTGLENKNNQSRNRAKSVFFMERLIFVPVSKIQNGIEQELLDIQVEDQKTFVANGILVHNTSLESLQCGTPVVSTKTGGLQDQNIDPDTGEVYGISIEPVTKLLVGSQQIPWIYSDHPSHQQMVDAFLKIYNMSKQDRDELGKRASESVLKRFDMNSMIDKWDTAIIKCKNDFKNGNPRRVRVRSF